MQNGIIAVDINFSNKLHSYLSNSNICSIKLEQFWLPQLPVTLEQVLIYKINRPVLLHISQQLIWNYYLPQFPEYWQLV